MLSFNLFRDRRARWLTFHADYVLKTDFQGKIDRLLEIVFLLFVNDEKLCICIQGVVLGDDAAIKHYLQDLSISNDFTERC